jgi:hypothetical protein
MELIRAHPYDHLPTPGNTNNSCVKWRHALMRADNLKAAEALIDAGNGIGLKTPFGRR